MQDEVPLKKNKSDVCSSLHPCERFRYWTRIDRPAEVSPSVLRQVYYEEQGSAVTSSCGAARWTRMRGGMRLGWGRVSRWKR